MFSRDGTKMVWRAYRPDTPEKKAAYQALLKQNLTTPMKMELWLANGDGSNAKQITNYGCASFAPTFTPDGKKLLFASNKAARFQPVDERSTRWVGSGAGDRLWRFTCSRVFTRRQALDFFVELSEQEQLRVQSVYGTEAAGQRP